MVVLSSSFFFSLELRTVCINYTLSYEKSVIALIYAKYIFFGFTKSKGEKNEGMDVA